MCVDDDAEDEVTKPQASMHQEESPGQSPADLTAAMQQDANQQIAAGAVDGDKDHEMLQKSQSQEEDVQQHS